MCTALEILVTKKFNRCLGFPLKYVDCGQKNFDLAVQKVQDKLVGWKANPLSLAGRRILSQSTTSSTREYVMRKLIVKTETFFGALHDRKESYIWLNGIK